MYADRDAYAQEVKWRREQKEKLAQRGGGSQGRAPVLARLGPELFHAIDHSGCGRIRAEDVRLLCAEIATTQNYCSS